MNIPFEKYQGTGNDFIILNNIDLGYTYEQLVAITKQVCQRRVSVGSDAVMVVDHAQHGGDFRMIFFNADGTEAEMCGNGARCLARYAYEHRLAKATMVIETVAGDVPAIRIDERTYQVQLNTATKEVYDWEIPEVSELSYVELGNPGLPHVIVEFDRLQDTPLEELLPLAQTLRHWSRLEKGTNVNFYQQLANGNVLIRTFERGVEGFTLACGTGSGATALTLIKRKKVKGIVTLETLGGLLQVEVLGDELFLRGETTRVVSGDICDEDLNV
ncbi:diaminopimelate epimerase [Enterococcus bulliens]